jgi:hypothetical protein
MRDRCARRQLRLGKERIFSRIFGKTVELKIEKRIIRPSTGLLEVSDWTLWRGRSPPKRKKRRQKHRIQQNFRKMMMVVHINILAPYQGTARDGRS